MQRVSRRDLLAGGCASLGALAWGCDSPTEGPKVSGKWTARVLAHPRAAPPFAPSRLRIVRDRLSAETALAPRPVSGDWQYDHPETGQSFEEYLRSHPTFPARGQRTLAILPLGDLAAGRTKIVELVAEYLGCHFGLPTRVLEPLALPLASVPAHAKRQRFGSTQLLTRWLLDSVLPAHRPSDASALLALTGFDLWPGENWNYVFGEASFDQRVGVWSLDRDGDPSASPAAFELALVRALKTAVHETGHMFSLPHCTKYPCVQAGINSLDEADKAPLWLCPECLPKIAWVTSTDPKARLRATLDFCRAHDLEARDHLEKSLASLA